MLLMENFVYILHILNAREDYKGNCNPEKTNVDIKWYPLLQSIFIILH